MVLRPRKFIYKNKQKNRKLKFFKGSQLSFGSTGLLLLQPLKLTSKRIFRYKLFFKKACKRSDRTLRKVWFNAFPYLPLSKKVKGSRMGKGKGKLSSWFADIPSGIYLVEYRNLRPGRAIYYSRQFQFKLTSRLKLKQSRSRLIPLTITNSISIKYSSVW